MEDRESQFLHIDSQMSHTDGGFLDMLYGENEGGNLQKDCTEIDTLQDGYVQDTEPELATKKHSKISK